MSKKIFRSIWLAALIVLVLSLVLIMGVLYSYFTGVQQKQLRMGAEVVAQGVALDGKEFFDGLTAEDYRITWIDADGTVLYDNQSDASSMENHLMREEVQQALQNGTGESSRYSDTLASRNLYCARLLPDDTIIRLSAAQHSVWVLLVGFAQPICVILLLALVLSFLLASRLSRSIVEPINSLNLDEPSQYVGREEYAEIEPLLRRMALQQAQIRQDQDKLEKSSQIRQEFTANVSHELKTPLHAISGYAELMENGMVQQQDIKPFAHKIRQESLRLTALVEDIINPLIGLFFKADFSEVVIGLGGSSIKIGEFVNSIINFLIVAFVLFTVIKFVNSLHKKPEEPAAPEEPTTKVCPYCQSEISIKAVRCPHCTSKLEGFPEINN